MARARRLLPVPQDVVDALAPVARRLGMSVPEFVEVVLGQAARVLRVRDDIGSALVEASLLADVIRLGGFVVPFDSLLALLDSVDEDVFDAFLRGVREYARLVGVSARARGLEEPGGLALLLRVWFPGMAVDVVEGDGGWKTVIASPLLSRSRRGRLLVASVVDSLVSSMGFTVVDREDGDGVVVVRFRRG